MITVDKLDNRVVGKRLSRHPSHHNQPKALAVDFFCGAGGTTHGFIKAGIKVVAGIDIDSSSRETYSSSGNNINPGDHSFPTFLALDVRPEKDGGNQKELVNKLEIILKEERIKHPNLPLLFSLCAPCQPFSSLTKNIAINKKADRRHRSQSNLLHQTLSYIDHFKPDAIFSENVPGISKETKFGPILRPFIKILNSQNYLVGSKTVNAKNFGVPQNRKRHVLVAIRSNNKNILDYEMDIPSEDSNSDILTVADVLGTEESPSFPIIAAGERSEIVPNHVSSVLTPINISRIRYSVPGKSNNIFKDTPDGDLRADCHKKRDRPGNRMGHTDAYTRMDPNKPSPTITTRCHSISNGRFGYPYCNQDRAISLREAATLQSFPPNYYFSPEEGIMNVAKQIGNAVPPKMAEFFASFITDLLDSI